MRHGYGHAVNKAVCRLSPQSRFETRKCAGRSETEVSVRWLAAQIIWVQNRHS
ncbi:hypothetical protein Fuma_04289 [Fuerstiella marisgermanici]|uniref:Uncharacterized protein n=1 Tax=Fuerstiella marisgermanici TaxID=1891926 RepID=A0A1P8WKR5_9PLAN|nr:hypothetical protein Fuma_04289 [Fuerstiella marisgermanici]